MVCAEAPEAVAARAPAAFRQPEREDRQSPARQDRPARARLDRPRRRHPRLRVCACGSSPGRGGHGGVASPANGCSSRSYFSRLPRDREPTRRLLPQVLGHDAPPAVLVGAPVISPITSPNPNTLGRKLSSAPTDRGRARIQGCPLIRTAGGVHDCFRYAAAASPLGRSPIVTKAETLGNLSDAFVGAPSTAPCAHLPATRTSLPARVAATPRDCDARRLGRPVRRPRERR